MQLRPYQQAAVDAATSWMKRRIDPGLLELATGAGKSWICADIAHWVYENSGKKVLCLQPSKELTEQNHDKYLATGQSASIFSASAGAKCMRHNIVYGTPGTVKNSISRFGDKFAAVIIDEAHGITPTIQFIIAKMREKNPKLRVIGMTATPYRLNTGYIYQYDLSGQHVGEDCAKDPYFNTLLYSIGTNELIDMGFLTFAHADPSEVDSYKAGNMQLNSRGKFDAKEVEQVFEGKGRLTSAIVADVVSHSAGRCGVMLFAATVQHAKEIMQSLPPANAKMLGGDVNMKKGEREALINDFKAQRFKYIVSVGTLTTGFDAPHVDLVAILRPTESPGLLQQIIGRGLRLFEGKEDCLILDYAENIERHKLHNDLFTPEVRVSGGNGPTEMIEAVCTDCGYINSFSARPNPDNFKISDEGYFLDAAGVEIETEQGFMPAHFGRRCLGQIETDYRGVFERCGGRWTAKECPECHADNDIAARFCFECKEELVDPNEKLMREFIRVKKDPYIATTDKVLSWEPAKHISVKGNETVRVTYKTEYRTFKVYYMPKKRDVWESFSAAVFSGHIAPDVDTFIMHISKGRMPETITCKRKRGSDFYDVIAHNQKEDKV
jgi:DNA repair protein RadD